MMEKGKDIPAERETLTKVQGVAFPDKLKRLQKLAKEWKEIFEELRKDKIKQEIS